MRERIGRIHPDRLLEFFLHRQVVNPSQKIGPSNVRVDLSRSRSLCLWRCLCEAGCQFVVNQIEDFLWRRAPFAQLGHCRINLQFLRFPETRIERQRLFNCFPCTGVGACIELSLSIAQKSLGFLLIAFSPTICQSGEGIDRNHRTQQGDKANDHRNRLEPLSACPDLLQRKLVLLRLGQSGSVYSEKLKRIPYKIRPVFFFSQMNELPSLFRFGFEQPCNGRDNERCQG